MCLELVIEIFANTYVLKHSLKFWCVLKTTCLLLGENKSKQWHKVTKNPPDYILIALCDGLGGSSPKENFTWENFGDLLFRFHCLW